MNKLQEEGTYVGIDLGTNNTFLLGSLGLKGPATFELSVPTIVGEIPADTVLGVFDQTNEPFVGDDAIRESDYLEIRRPLRDGVISDIGATAIFFRWLRSRVLEESPEKPVYAVVGIPATTSEKDRLALGEACRGIFENYILVPEPFLAALGYRDDSKLKAGGYHDPVRNSLVIDIGAGTTDLCVVQGRFPTEKDTSSFPMAGDWIDEQVGGYLKAHYPAFDLAIDVIRRMKEQHAAVQKKMSASSDVVIKGKKKTIDISEPLSEALSALLDKVTEEAIRAIESSPSRMSEVLVKNILITGGGSQIRNFDKALQDRLLKSGFEAPECRSVGSDYWRLVGAGAHKLALAASRDQWQANL